MTPPYSGIFNEFWDGNPNHLPFLHLSQTEGLDRCLQLLGSIIAKYPVETVLAELKKLLADDNWRPHLVACVSVFLLPANQRTKIIPELWNRLNQYSWVSPQILVTLFIIDPDFKTVSKQVESTHYRDEKAMSSYRSLTEDSDQSGYLAIKWKHRLGELSAAKTIREL